jgi:hypothetical protein
MLNDNVIMTCKLTRKMSQILPNFKVNVTYRAVKVSKLFSFLAKAENDTYEKSDVVYEFTCPCKEIYIGHTRRMLITRIREHQQNSSQTNVILHITCCDAYIENSQNFVDENIENFTGLQKTKFQNFKDKFKIIKSGFRYKNDREKAEAFLIRVNKPSPNDQWDHKAFKLF